MGKGIGRQASREKGKETTHIEVSSDEDVTENGGLRLGGHVNELYYRT